MSSRVGESGQRTGEFRGRVQEAAGERPLRTGSAVPLIRWVSFVLAVLCVAVAWAMGVVNGVLILALAFTAVHAWSVGMFSARFWVD